MPEFDCSSRDLHFPLLYIPFDLVLVEKAPFWTELLGLISAALFTSSLGDSPAKSSLWCTPVNDPSWLLASPEPSILVGIRGDDSSFSWPRVNSNLVMLLLASPESFLSASNLRL
ncbi:hypothetical protein MLD38_035186 [Melastoma candidum]|uniref:Uncharacterized protein n=1 Tax=Melastoma candidum TaxID=119954 RepID=A0ACB9MC00_9MYRT|nr:hypothetical protein MLD38_035186 [Melastoma candidum]